MKPRLEISNGVPVNNRNNRVFPIKVKNVSSSDIEECSVRLTRIVQNGTPKFDERNAIIKRWSRPTVAPTNQMDPEIPLSQAEEEKSPARVRKTLNAAFDPSEKLIRSCSLF
jgi:hypothetical protein